MDVSPSIFKTYDIRGIWGQDINVDIAEAIGQAYATFLKPKRVVCGCDVRNSGPEFQAAVIRGMQAMGVDVVDIGVVTSDAMYFAVGKYGFDGGAMVTASHNPPEWNGIKFTRDQARPLVGQENKEIGKLTASEQFEPIKTSSGKLEYLDISLDYVAQILSFHQPGQRKLKVVIDPGNGTVIRFLEAIMSGLPYEWVGINMTPDGNFPGRNPNPLAAGALDQLTAQVREVGADVGVAFDADADRMFFTDERGKRVFGDVLTALLAKQFLKKYPGSAIVYNLICSHIVPEEIAKAGGRPIRSAVGHANMKPMMRNNDAVFGGEISGHYFFRDHFYADAGLAAMVVGLDFLSAQTKSLSQLVQEVDIYYHLSEINSTVADIPGTIEKIKQKYSDGKIDETDGITVEYPDWWFNVRASNTEPLLRLSVESKKNQADLDRHREELLAIIRG